MRKLHLHFRPASLALAISTVITSSCSFAQIEEIIVTSEFRERNVQATPIAITAVTSEMLDARSQTNIFEVANQAPNVTLKPGGQARSGMVAFIRGIGQVDFIAALEPGVGIYVDDVYYSQLTGSLLDLLDLERVEVLRGPQGTLSGRNSIGGAIKLYSKRPGAEEGGNISVGYGSYNQVDVRGSGDFTLVENTLYGRVSGASRNRDGYVDIVDFGCVLPSSGAPINRQADGCKLGELGNQVYTTGRASLRWLPSDDLEVFINADFLNDSSGASANTLLWGDRTAIEANPANPTIALGNLNYRDHKFVPYGDFRNKQLPFNDPYISFASFADPNTGNVIGGGNPAPRATVPWLPLYLPSRNYLDSWGLSAQIDYDLTEDFALTSISSYKEYDSWMTWDSDNSPIPVTMLDNRLDHWSLSQEFRLNGAISALDYTLGAFYFKQQNHYEARVTLPYASLDFVHGPDPTPSTTWALFANGTWNITDQLSLTGGVRYSDEYKSYTHFRHNPDGTDVAAPGQPGFPVNVRVLGVNGLTAVFQDERTDWRVAANYQIDDNLMVYTSAATGYKSGGVNPRPFFPQQLNVFEPETLLSYEVGFKSTLLDSSLRLNGAVFYTNYEDIQLTLNECEVPTFIDPDGISAPCAKPANVGNADIKGVELEVEYFFTEDLFVDAAISTLDFKYTEINPLALRGSTIRALDMITPYTPELKWNVGVQYSFPVTEHGRLKARVDANYQDEVYSEPTNNALNLIEDYTLYNARLWWTSPDEDWEIALEGQNLTDDVYFYTKFEQALSVGQVTATPGLPRTWRINARKSF
ncbi:MAG: TonB-dependent receptor [Pseudomonadota bacterium]